MVCRNCLQEDNEIFKYKCNVFGNRHYLVLFLVNIILNIKKMRNDFCKCDGETICLVCQSMKIYKDYEHVVYRNCLNLDFLCKVRENLIQNMYRLFTMNNHFVCKIINEKYQYDHKDWFTGNKNFYDLDSALTFFEQKQINKIINNNCKVLVEKIFFF